ncbi:MAG TPA: hypothetical protein VMS18_23425 [Candidatus Binatia bacterium]|nr:hypothetical protein [Candidatus Binatia bacterium]
MLRKSTDGSTIWNGPRNGELARALALRLSENRAHLVQQRLAGVGWRLDGTQFVPTERSNTVQHVFFPAGAVRDAFVHIRSLFKGASKDVRFCEGRDHS